MSSRLCVPLVAACLLLTGQALVRGQGYYPPAYCPPGSPGYPYAPLMPSPYAPAPGYAPSYPAFPGSSPAPSYPPSMPGPSPSPSPTPTPTPSPTPTPTPTPGNGTPTPSPSQNSPSQNSPSTPSAADSATSSDSSAGDGAAGQGDGSADQGGNGSDAARGGDESAQTSSGGTSESAGLPTVGDFFGVRYRRLVNVPLARTVTYSVTNTNPISPTTINLARPRSNGSVLATRYSIDGGPAIAVAPGVVNAVTLAPGQTATVTATGTVIRQVSVLDYVGARGGIKISDFESARPRDRAYLTGFYYNNALDRTVPVPGPTVPAGGRQLFADSPEVTSSLLGGSAFFNDDAVLSDVTNTVLRQQRVQVTRQTIGFERTYEFGGVDGSFGMRLPFFQVSGDDPISDVGDLTLIWKAILCGGFNTEDVVTAGLVVSLPTGPKLVTTRGDINSVLVQPWLGYLWNLKCFYIQGFHGAVVPTEGKDTGFVFNTLTVGYYLYEARKRGALISLLAAQIEGHATNPLKSPNDVNAPIVVNNLFVTTAAVHVGLGSSALLTVGGGTPIGGFRPYEFEASAMLNLYF